MFNSSSGLSASDVLSLSKNDDGFGSNGAWWIIILALLFGWGGGFGYNNNQGAQSNYVLSSDFATLQRQIDTATSDLKQSTTSIGNGICSLGYDQLAQMNGINTNILTTGNAIATQVADSNCQTQRGIDSINTANAINTSTITAAINSSTCDNERLAMQAEYNAQARNCSTLQAIDKVGDRIIDYLNADKAQALRDENQALRLAASQQSQNTAIINALRPFPVPSFNVGYNPYNYGYGGTTIA